MPRVGVNPPCNLRTHRSGRESPREVRSGFPRASALLLESPTEADQTANPKIRPVERYEVAKQDRCPFSERLGVKLSPVLWLFAPVTMLYDLSNIH